MTADVADVAAAACRCVVVGDHYDSHRIVVVFVVVDVVVVVVVVVAVGC